ncbi:MAG: hypothetical protein Q9186_006160 [Xanthomendoza sp. 1 TL-2023]
MASPVDRVMVGRPSTEASSPKALNCKDPKTGVAQKCWNELHVDQYMKNWHKLNFPKTCKKGDDFSTCFGRLAVSGNDPQNCTSLASRNCKKLDPTDHYLAPEWFYGAYNSWAIHEFFVNWANATRKTAAKNPTVISTAATPVDFDSFAVAKTGGLSNIDVALNGLLTAAGNSPQNLAFRHILNKVAPTSKLTYKSTEDGIKTAKPTVAELVVKRLEEVLMFVETNLTGFLAMAANGTFSTSEVVTEVSLVSALVPDAGDIATVDDGAVEEVVGKM